MAKRTTKASRPSLKIEQRPIDSLKPRPGNPRTHSPKQIRQIADSIRRFGFTNPILVDEAGGIVAGHGRVEAARLLGQATVPVIRLAAMSEADVRAYVIADNRLAELAGWDRDLLAIELLQLSDLDLDFDLTITGFEVAEIDLIIGEHQARPQPDPDDEVLPEPEARAVTRPDDLWLIGRHRLLCGDATDPAAYEALLAGGKAEMVFTDPPYNVPIGGHVSGLGAAQHREFAMTSGEMTSSEFTAFLADALGRAVEHSRDGALHYVAMDWRHLRELMEAGSGLYSELKNLCVWAKTNGGMGSLYRSQHELVLVYKVGKAPHINNVELGKHGRSRTNVWSYPGANSFRKGRDEDLAMHPTVKPVALVADAILDASRRKGLVLDPFAGSGTTLLAAERTGRVGCGLELDPLYCDVIIRRLAKARLSAQLASDGRSFEEVAAERAAIVGELGEA